MSMPQQQLPDDDSLLKRAFEAQKKKLRNKLIKKGAKLAAKAIKTVAMALAKLLMALLSYIGLPVVLISAGIIFLVIIISLIMSYSFATGDGLKGQEKEIYEYIVQASNRTVDMSNSLERQYRVPSELIASIIQIDAFQKYNNIQDMKNIIDRIATDLSPTFTYGDYNEWVETRTTVCDDEGCSSPTVSKTNHIVKKIEEVDNWKGSSTFDYEAKTSNWVVTKSSSEEGSRTITDPKTGKSHTESYTVSTTVEERQQTYSTTETTTDDYTQLDNILNSYDLGINDKKLIEINYMFAGGGDINYTNWIEGKSFDENGSTGLYACSPTGNVDMMKWKTVFASAGVLAGHDQEIIDIAKEKGIDPVLFASITIAESTWGKSHAIQAYNNPGGLMNPSTGTLFHFSTLSEGLQSMGRTLHNRILVDGLNTIEKLGNHYAPLNAKNDPAGLNKHWIPNVTSIASQLGGLTMNCDKPADLATDGGTSGIGVVDVGKKWIHHSVYVFGGGRNQRDIAQGRFDCSSFVHWAFKQVGMDLGPLGSTSTETLKNKGRPVSASDMKPGDIIFFNTYKRDGHVAIYIGNGKFIGAQSSTGVAIADMSSGYWKQKFNGRVKRLLN